MRFLLLLLSFGYVLVACESGWLTCKQKAVDAGVFRNGHFAIPLAPTVRLVYSEQDDPKFSRYDPLLGLALVEDKKPFAYPYTLVRTIDSKKVAAIDARGVHEVKRVSAQCGLDRLGVCETSASNMAFLSDSCCALHALITPRGVIDAAFIDYFKSAAWAGYGDAGIRLGEREGGVVVASIDPFFEPLVFELGDRLMAFDGHTYRSVCAFEKAILLSRPGSTHRFKVARGGRVFDVDVLLERRLGGGLRPDTYLERLGILLDERYCIDTSSMSLSARGLQKGDCLIQINHQDIKAHSSDAMLWLQGDNALLFERRGLQFFIHIKSKDAKMPKKI